MATLTDACHFFNRCAPCLANMKYRGVKVNVPFLTELGEKLGKELSEIESYFDANPSVKAFLNTTGRSFKIASNKDLEVMLFQVMALSLPSKTTARGHVSVDDDSLAEVSKHARPEAQEFITKILRYRKLSKQKSTYIDSPLKGKDQNDLLHPSFMLHTTRTYRSSSEGPNFQNFPKRDPEMRAMRKAFIPQLDFFLEADFKGSEVAVMGMVSGDTMLRRQLAADEDIHKYWAAELYEIPKDQVTKEHRFVAKNGFVFPLFYGSWYGSIAKSTGLPESQVERAEKKFWLQYPSIRRFRDECYRFYNEHLYIETRLGFRRNGPLSKNQQINSEIQGTSFHLLLAGAQKLDDELIRRQMRSMVVIEVHDSVVVDTADDELEEVVSLMKECLTHQHFPWMSGVQMRIDLSIGTNWAEMETLAA